MCLHYSPLIRPFEQSHSYKDVALLCIIMQTKSSRARPKIGIAFIVATEYLWYCAMSSAGVDETGGGGASVGTTLL